MRDIFDVCQKHGLPSLAQGMIEFPPPAKLRAIAAQTVTRDEVHTYRNRMGEQDYRSSMAGLVRSVYGEQVDAENVLAVAGVAGGVSAALFYFRRKKPDATVAIMEPFYTYHSMEVERAFCRAPAVIPVAGEDPLPNWAELTRRVEEGQVHGVIVTNPLNPSGYVFTPEDVSRLVTLSQKHELFVIFDECYLDMVFNGKTHASPFASGIHDNIVACRGFSKCMGCQSWRVGYAISSPSTILGMMQMMDPLFICANWTQHALGEYFRTEQHDFEEHCKSLKVLLQENWQLLSTAFQRRFGWVPFEPNGTMYGMFRHSDETDIKACERALQAGVGVCPGNVFFGDVTNPTPNTGWVRIHCGVSREKAQDIVNRLSMAA